ncbi:MAG TPA: prephenate dehydratase [Candidatus Binataceae bacterium]|nr:prephenate dehydratase [Candidatus Binataceae bacterium]
MASRSAKRRAPARARQSSETHREDKPSLASLRDRIDEIDRKVLGLVALRAAIALQVGQLKHSTGEVVYVPSRERAIIDRMIAENPGPLAPEHIQSIFTEIISACRGLEHPARIAFLGPEHTYSHEAARERFGSSVEFAPQSSIAAVFQAVDSGRADFGVVPVENSTEGSVGLTLDLLIDTRLKIIGEILLPVRHSLLSLNGDPRAIVKIVSHQQSLGQCRGYLQANFPDCEIEAVASNAFATERAAHDASVAAIASREAGAAYGLIAIAENIQDLATNTTRFLVMGARPVEHTGADKTTVLFAVADKVGALYEAITLFARNSINISKIESRPLRSRPWEYIFFVDLGGHRDDPRLKRALKALERKALFSKVLGSYPEGRSAAG